MLHVGPRSFPAARFVDVFEVLLELSHLTADGNRQWCDV